MAMNDDRKYDSDELDYPTTAPSYKPTTVIKYMATRTTSLNLSSSFPGSLHNTDLSNFKPSPITTRHGVASLVPTSALSMDSINGELTIDEHRDLSKLNETLTKKILYCYYLDAHNRAQESQIEWFEKHSDKNYLIIEKMFRTEIQTGRQLIEDIVRYKSDLEKKLNHIHQATLANDEYYQQLLSKRNMTNKELFISQRQLAQNRAEIEFLRSRIQFFHDEIQFYKVKNSSLQARTVKLHSELDEEILTKQVLQMECQSLENEKITNEDIHLSSIDDIRGSIDFNQEIILQPSNSYHEQLNHQLRQMRLEYNKKIQIYRDELHRKYELESYRYKIYNLRSIPTVTREHEQKLEQYKREKKDVEQQINSIRGSFSELENRIEILERQIDEVETISNSQRHFTMLEQIIREKEKQLDEAIRIRTMLKQQIENYREESNRYPKRITQIGPRKSILRSSASQDGQPISLFTRPTKDTPIEEGTLVRFTDFDVERDCEMLNQIFNEPNIDEITIINILCNRSVAQRLQIRDTYKNRFGQNLGNVIESKIRGNSKKIFKILLLSPIERDCFELRRVLKGMNIDENILIEIFLSRSNKQIKTIVNNYSKLFNNTLEQDLITIEETYSKQIFLALLQANRPEDQDINNDEILDNARNLYETNSKWRIDGSTFIQLLCNRSNTQLKQIFDAYEQFSGINIEQTIKIDTDADLSRTLMAIIRIIRNRPRFFAYELRKSLQNSGSNEDNLNRIIISRCEVDMVQIKSEYEKIAKRPLDDQIQTDTNRDYQRAILELIRQRIQSTFLQSPKTNRRTVQWKEEIDKQSLETNENNRDVNHLKSFIQFDRNNQAKSNTLSTMNTRLQSIERPSNENNDE